MALSIFLAVQCYGRTNKRYDWLTHRLVARKDVFAIFPESWHVKQLLCVMFCQVTRSQLAEVLEFRVSNCRSSTVTWSDRMVN